MRNTCEVEDKDIEYVNNATFHKDSAHYLRNGICKGSKADYNERLERAEKKWSAKGIAIPEKALQAIHNNVYNHKFIFYDFETDTHTNTHDPNLCIAKVVTCLNDCEYSQCVQSNVIFHGYDCLD